MIADNLIHRAEAEQNRIRAFAFVIAASVSVLLSVYFLASGLPGLRQTSEIRLESRINPNKAPPASLVRLPGIGVGRAGAIVAYRESFSEKNGGKPAFWNCEDLQKVKGIGPKTAKSISKWLKFE